MIIINLLFLSHLLIVGLSLECLKPISVTTNVVGLQTASAGHVGQNSSAHVARKSGLQTDAVVVTETGLSSRFMKKSAFYGGNIFSPPDIYP